MWFRAVTSEMSGPSTSEACRTLWSESTRVGIVRYWVTCICFRAVSTIFSFSRGISVCLVILLATVFEWWLWAFYIPFYELITMIVALLIMLMMKWLGGKKTD